MNINLENIKTPYDLKRHTRGHYFDKDTMRFFGDTMANYAITRHGNGTIELRRKCPVKHGLRNSVYFRLSQCRTYFERF